VKVITTAQTNHHFGPPPGNEDRIGTLPCEIRETDLGKFIYATYEPTPEERQAIADGQNIELGVGWIGAFPPVSLGITPAKEVQGKAA
jgi:hypothetical protein